LLDVLAADVPSGLTSILDIGRSNLTALIAERTGARVDNLGFAADGPTEQGAYYHFDLNDSQFEDRWRRDMPAYDLIVMAEVIEHLHTSPLRVLPFLRSLLKPGGLLVVQTPNAVALHQRVKMLIGRNPYTLINPDHTDPLHFREYTERELRAFAKQTGFAVLSARLSAYFDYGRSRKNATAAHRLLGRVVYTAYQFSPRHLRPGITMVWRRDESFSPVGSNSVTPAVQAAVG
jgi:SAM-dependent methyltransferase